MIYLMVTGQYDEREFLCYSTERKEIEKAARDLSRATYDKDEARWKALRDAGEQAPAHTGPFNEELDEWWSHYVEAIPTLREWRLPR